MPAKTRNLTGRISGGIHYSTAGPNTNSRDTTTPGYGFTVMYQQELIDSLYIPYVGTFASFVWNEPQISETQWQFSIGFVTDNVFGRRDDGFGAAFGTSGYSNLYRPGWRREKTLDFSYRFQLTEDLTIGPEYTLVIDPGNPLTDEGPR